MNQSSIFAALGAPESIDAMNADRIDDMSVGELAYASALFSQKLSERLATPSVKHEIATYKDASGADWSGYTTSRGADGKSSHEPVEPENLVDAVPSIMALVAHQDRAHDAAMANATQLLQIASKDQVAYLGVPDGLKGFRNVKEMMTKLWRVSGRRATRILTRAKYVAHQVDADKTAAATAPKLQKIAGSFAAGNIPAENLDRIIAFDDDLTKYSKAIKRELDYKDQVIQAFEPTLQEAAESASPQELSQARQRWTEQAAHHIDADGPPPSEVLKKKPDNALHIRSHEDGSATASMHIEPVWAACLKEFLNTNLNYKGKKPLLPENIENLYDAMANARAEQDASAADKQDTTEHDPATSAADAPEPENSEKNGTDEPTSEASDSQPVPPETVIAQDDQGNDYTREQIDWIDKLTRPQRAGAILLGAVYSVMSMHPDDAAAKRAHGSPAKLVIVQDIQTAHVTLGLPALPQAVQRPPGPDGFLPPIIKRPNPGSHGQFEPPDPNIFTGYANPVPWTAYQSEIINIGPIHPRSTETMLCDVELVGQIWNGQDTVLNEYRSKRLFTTAQRKAIFARDKGCQTPGCIVQAAYCQCHHVTEWSNGGETNENNAVTLCQAHHTDVHDGKWTIRQIDGVTYFQPAKWLDPYQPLLRNLYWNS